MRSFAAVSGDHPHTLILGSMPGTRSLEEKAYYAHPRNAFWPILLAWLTGRTAHYELADDFPYEKRLSLLTSAGFALWDVLADCERRGSLDTAIVRHSSRANPIAAFVQQHPMLRQVLFNGRAAHDLWQRHIQPDVPATGGGNRPPPASADIAFHQPGDGPTRSCRESRALAPGTQPRRIGLFGCSVQL